MSDTPWTVGDRVRHPTKPEWGGGLITAVEPAQIDGKPTQRLTIRFERAGIKKLAASVARLEPAGAPSDAASRSAGPGSPLPAPDIRPDAELKALLVTIPESARDPFASLATRFERSLGLYRFRSTGGSLLDWAASQTGLADPLSRFSRHDLEDAFTRFRRQLDQHAASLGLDLVRTDQQAAARIVAAAPDDAKALMRRIAARR